MKRTHKSADELDALLHSFIQMRFETCQHSFFYFKSKDIFEYTLKPNVLHKQTYMNVDTKNLGGFITKMQRNYEGNYKDIYKITTYIHRKRSHDTYKVELINNENNKID